MARLNKNQQLMDPLPTIRLNYWIEIRLLPPDFDSNTHHTRPANP
jgi:hypothetical protein